MITNDNNTFTYTTESPNGCPANAHIVLISYGDCARTVAKGKLGDLEKLLRAGILEIAEGTEQEMVTFLCGILNEMLYKCISKEGGQDEVQNH